MRIILICKDMGGYIRTVANYLSSQGHDVLFLDTTQSAPALQWLSGKLKKLLRARLGRWLDLWRIRSFGAADTLLVVNPGQVNAQIITKAMSVSQTRKAYLYDSLARSPVSSDWLARFDQVLSFDQTDIDAHGLHRFHNFIYDTRPSDIPAGPRPYKAFLVMAGVDRLKLLDDIAGQLALAGFDNYLFIVQYKTAPATRSNIRFTRERLSLQDVQAHIKDSDILLDLVRPNQTGLSFRLFEALHHRRKVITNNPSVVDYDFYHPDNILLIDDQNPHIPASFLQSDYHPIAPDILHKYTLPGWCARVFATA
jgi:hypothetical protein